MKNKDLNKQFNIPTWVSGNTPSEEAKSIQKRFKDRKDKASVETMEELLQAVAQKQEYVKMQESLENESKQIPDQMHGQVPEGMEQFAGGGPMYMNGQIPQGTNQFMFGGMPGGIEKASGFSGSMAGAGLQEGATGSEVMGSIGAGIGAATTAVDFGKQMLGSSGVDTSGMTAAPQVESMGSSAFSGATKGATTGAMFGPWGAAIGGAVGGISGLIGGGKAKKDAMTAENNHAVRQNFLNNKAYGGKMNSYPQGGPLTEAQHQQQPAPNYFSMFNQNPTTGSYESRGLSPNTGGFDLFKPKNTDIPRANTTPITPDITPDIPQKRIDEVRKFANPFTGAKEKVNTDKEKVNTDKEKVNPLQWLGKNAGNIAQYAPIIGNLTDKVERANNPRRDRLNTNYKKTLMDERTLQNIVQNEHGNVSNALRDASGGSGGRLSSNLLAASLNKTKALSGAYAQSTNVNRQEQAQANMFNLRRDSINLQQSNADTVDKQMNEGAYNSAKSAKRTTLFEDLGKIGKEEVDKKLVKEMFGYGWDGTYFKDEEGNQYTPKQMAAKIKKQKAEEAKAKTD
jgi:hypothetical protein|tara:strand:- start:5778 stop:7481 length:1704 start_codon:yes stop_codon:yes gene_type:complete